MKRTAEWRGIKADLTWWATQRPEVVVAFVRSTHDLLGGHGTGAAGGHGWGASARGWADAPWRRSAVAFLQVGERQGGGVVRCSIAVQLKGSCNKQCQQGVQISYMPLYCRLPACRILAC